MNLRKLEFLFPQAGKRVAHLAGLAGCRRTATAPNLWMVPDENWENPDNALGCATEWVP